MKKVDVIKRVGLVDANKLKKAFLLALAESLEVKLPAHIKNGLYNLGGQKEFAPNNSFSKEFIKNNKGIRITEKQQSFLKDNRVSDFLKKYPKVTISRSKLVDLQYALNEVHARIPKHTSLKRDDGKLRWSPEMKEFLKTQGIKEFLKKYDDVPRMKASAMYYSMRRAGGMPNPERLSKEQAQMIKWSEESKVREMPVRKCAFCLDGVAESGSDLCADCKKIDTGHH